VLIARVATALAAAPIILVLAWFGGVPFWILAATAAGIAAWEASGLLGGRAGAGGNRGRQREESEEKPRAADLPSPRLGEGEGEGSRCQDEGTRTRSNAVAVGGAVALVLGAAAGPTVALAVVAVLLVIALALSLGKGLDDDRLAIDWAASLVASLYAGLPLALLVLIRQWPGTTGLALGSLGALGRGTAWLLLALTSVWAVDSAAYAVGRLAGRRRLWPRVSPNKTWEGTGAGIVAGIVVCAAWAPALRLSGGFALALGLTLAAAAVLGDLVESALKRAAHVKDAGTLLPGHGGLLDRIDGLAFVAVVVFLSGVLSGSAGSG